MAEVYFELSVGSQEISDTIKRSLAIIGKRSVDDNGQSMYRDIMMGSNEEDLIGDYISEAAQHIASKINGVINSVGGDEELITSINVLLPSNYNDGLEALAQRTFKAYCVAYALYSWFTITAPTLAGKYEKMSQQHLDEIVSLIYSKKAPNTPTETYADVTGNITDVTPEDKGELIATYTADHDCSEDGGDDLPHHNGTNVFLIPRVYDDNRIYTLEYSGDDTIFYYTIGLPDGMGGYNYPTTERSTTTEGFSELIHANSDNDSALLIWLDNKSAGTNTIKVYRK